MKRLLFCLLAMIASGGVKAQELLPSETSVLNDLFVHQWVAVGEGGRLTGNVENVSTSESVQVTLSSGRIRHVSKTNEQGDFAFMGIQPGTYTLVARGNGAFAAISLRVLSGENGSHLTEHIALPCISPVGPKINEILRAHSLPSGKGSRFVTTTSSLSDPLAGQRRFAATRAVALDAEGRLNGRVAPCSYRSRDLSELTVYVLKDGQEVARANPNTAGVFSIGGLAFGSYGVVVSGQAGFAAVGVAVVPAKVASTASAVGNRYVFQQDAASNLNLELTEVTSDQPVVTQEDGVVEEGPVVSEVVVGEPAPAYGVGGYGGYGGMMGGGGSGGGSGGIGGFAGLAGMAGLATVAAIVASDDDNNNPVPIVSF